MEDFQQQVRVWADKVRRQAKANAAGFSKGKTKPHTYITGRYAGKTEGKLKNKLTYTLRKRYGDIEAVSFRMPVHGIFREYGVGNGQPRNGIATKSGRAASKRTYIKRTPADWFHDPLEKNIDNFGDIVADYYGDKILVAFQELKIDN